MTNHAHGHEAEKRAAEFLKKQGYKIVGLNWRHPRAEIDIIARKKGGPLTFVEVKYREQDGQGMGLEYITRTKFAQMEFAAQLWVTEHTYEGEFVLGAVELYGAGFEIGEFIAEL